MASAPTVKYWRREQHIKNFGDYLADFLLETLFAPLTTEKGPVRLIGSALADFQVNDDFDAQPIGEDGARPLVTFWGCGARDESGLSDEVREKAKILAVRGPLTASVLNIGAVLPQGDPGLFLPALYDPQPATFTQGKSVCIPHFWDRRSDEELLAESGCDVVVRTNIAEGRYELLRVIDAIASADFVLSASLHGAITAAAYGRPFGYWDNGHLDLPFKWKDFSAYLSIPCVFHKSLAGALESYQRDVRGKLRFPSLWPLLANAPFLVRPAALLKVLKYDLRDALDAAGLGHMEEKVQEIERRNPEFVAIVDETVRDLERLRADLLAANADRKRMEADFAATHSDLASAGDALAAMQSQYLAAVAAKDSIEKAFAQFRAVAVADTEERLALTSLVERRKLEIEYLKQQVAAKAQASDLALARIVELENDLAQSIGKQTQLADELRQTESALGTIKVQSEDVKRELAFARDHIVKLGGHVRRTDARAAQAETDRAKASLEAIEAWRAYEEAQWQARQIAEQTAAAWRTTDLSLPPPTQGAAALVRARGEGAVPFSALRPRLVGEVRRAIGAAYRAVPLARDEKLRVTAAVVRRIPQRILGRRRDEWLGHVQARLALRAELRAQARSIQLPLSSRPLVSVIIPNYGNPEMAMRLLRSLADNPPRSPVEHLLWEDASGDSDVDVLKQVGGLRYHANAKNLGFIGNCNSGAAAARGKYLLFLNSDTVVTPGWLDALVEVADSRGDAGIVGSKLIFPDGALQEAGGILWNDASAWNFGRNGEAQAPEYNYLREVDYISGASILISRELFAKVGCFSTEFQPAYCEDTDLALKVRNLGKKVYYQPRSVVEHHEGASNGTNIEMGVKAYQRINQEKLHQRWKDVLERENFPNGVDVFMAKDRAMTRRSVLVIDHYVPKPDRDAGSRTIFQFLETLVQDGWVVKFWPENLHFDPDYTPALLDMGVEVFTGPKYHPFEQWYAQHSQYFDVVLASRPHITTPILEALTQNREVGLAYYGHDIHHLRMIDQAQVDPSAVKKKDIANTRDQEKAIWSASDVVIYPSSFETDYIHEAAPNIDARTVSPYFYPRFEHDAARNLSERSDVLFVAGFGHPPNVDAAVWLVEEIMPLVWARTPEAKLSLVGSYPTETVQALANERVVVTGWVSDADLNAYYRGARVAAVPLRFGAGIKSKVVEAMANGLPLVTTTTGLQGLSGAEDGVAVHDDAASFAEAIIALLHDDNLWRARSKAESAFAESRFSRETMRRQLSGALVAAIDHARARFT